MVRFFWFFVIILAGCSFIAPATSLPTPDGAPTSTATGNPSNLPDDGAAPELTNTVWLNTDHPLRLADLHGKVVLLEMWTFECINCRHVTPMLKQWYRDYAKSGLVIIGNHYPEFPYEADLTNLKKAVADQGILYPIAQDNDGATWDAYHNRYWPTLYLIDRSGHIRYKRIGEGGYEDTEAAIKWLLNEAD
jgi:thiol-disulfide isomerase/thioredoxin